MALEVFNAEEAQTALSNALSHNEELIRFSNDNFYESSLYTFPESKISDVIDFKYVELKEQI